MKINKELLTDEMFKKTTSEMYRNIRDKMLASSATELTIFKFFLRSET